jgi:hypothetical protein
MKPELNPLKKWVLSNKFYIKITDTKEKKTTASHFLLDGGIWSIPKDKYLNFLELLAIDLQNGEKHYICENRTSIFKFICDIDMFETEICSIEKISSIVTVLNQIVNEYYQEKKVIICGADSKTVKINEIEMIKSGFHLVWPDIWISVDNAKKLRILFIEKLILTFGEREVFNKWEDVVDLAVFEDNGLRMVGCRKMAPCKSCKNKKEFRENCESCDGSGKKDENRIYSPKAVIGNCERTYFSSISNFHVMLNETSIYNYNDVPETPLIKNLDVVLTKKKIKNKVVDDITLKVEAFIKRAYKSTHNRIKIIKLVKNESCYYAEPDDNFCMNVNRNHTSSTVYFQLSPSGVSQRCYCKKESIEGRLNGMCKHYASPEIPLTKVLSLLLFGSASSKKKKIVNTIITRNSSTSSLDLSVSVSDNHKETINLNKETCLMNCKNILFQIENEFLKET